MPRSKKRQESSGSESSSDSGPDDPTPPKKVARVEASSSPAKGSSKGSSAPASAGNKGKKSSSNDEDGKKFQLDRNRFVTVREFRGKVLIDIREFYTTADGEERPGKKGISLNATQWNKLKSVMDDVDAAVADF